ncbi:MAG: zinc transporter ZupT [Verrucomicrobiota bacterium]
MSNIVFAFTLTLFAGLATGIGSGIAFFARKTNYRFLSITTGFSAGVMLYVSFVEILLKGQESLTKVYGESAGAWINTAAFFGGMLVIGIIDNLIPSAENPHETHTLKEQAPLRDDNAPRPDFEALAEGRIPASQGAHDHRVEKKHLLRMGLFTALAITIHNFPEGLATFISALEDPSIGIAIAVALALHNIPEGISVSVPIFYATNSRKKAFFYSLLSGLAEPLGAGVAFIVMITVFGGSEASFPANILGVVFAGVAGIMVYISLDELLPTSRAYGKGHDSLFGLVAGMLIMALSLLLL